MQRCAWGTTEKQAAPGRLAVPLKQALLGDPHVRETLVTDVSTTHARPDVLRESTAVLTQVSCGVCVRRVNYSLHPRSAPSLTRALTLVERIISVGLEEEILQPDHDGVQVQDWLPVFAKNVEAHIAFEIDVRVVDLGANGESRSAMRREAKTARQAHLRHAFDFWGVMRVV